MVQKTQSLTLPSTHAIHTLTAATLTVVGKRPSRDLTIYKYSSRKATRKNPSATTSDLPVPRAPPASPANADFLVADSATAPAFEKTIAAAAANATTPATDLTTTAAAASAATVVTTATATAATATAAAATATATPAAAATAATAAAAATAVIELDVDVEKYYNQRRPYYVDELESEETEDEKEEESEQEKEKEETAEYDEDSSFTDGQKSPDILAKAITRSLLDTGNSYPPARVEGDIDYRWGLTKLLDLRYYTQN